MLHKYLMNLFVLFLISGFFFMVSCKSMIENDPMLVKSYEGQEKNQGDDLTSTRDGESQALIHEADVHEGTVSETAKYRFYNQDVLFIFDDYSLSVAARTILKEKAQWMNTNPDESIIIEGHCDERGTNEYNLALGDRRAESVKSFLVDLGIDEKRIKTVSYGEERPLDSQSDEAAWLKNRRAHFVNQ